MTRKAVWQECLHYASYYAPRGKPRLLLLGSIIGQRYLLPEDKLVGIIGEPGTGKSSIVRGMFPGLELTNDDERINVRPVPLLRHFGDGQFGAYTYHIDIQFERAFAQPFEIAEAVKAALKAGRRVVIEHFDAIHGVLGINAQCLLGIGEEILVARPSIFGPFPEDIKKRIAGTAIFRKMAHSAEDITSMIMERDFGYAHPDLHSDVPRGFVIEFDQKPERLDLEVLERKVKELIAASVAIQHLDENHIKIGSVVYPCTGPRIHVKDSAEIRDFRLDKAIQYDEINGVYCLVGRIGEPKESCI